MAPNQIIPYPRRISIEGAYVFTVEVRLMAKKLGLDDRSTILYDLHEYGINEVTRELFLHRYIHNESETAGDCGVDYRMAVTFIKNLLFLDRDPHEPITIYMQSRGGDEQDGYAIYDVIKACKSHIMCIVYAHARSMTSIILQAADKRVMMPNCIFVAHYGWLGGGEDRVQPVLSQMEFTKEANEHMLRIYAERCKDGEYFKGQQRKTIIEYIRGKLQEKTDWILTAEEAVRYGFADEVYNE